MFLKRVEEIGEKGWEILETRAECRVPPFLDPFPHIPLHFVLRRRAN
jgi:hypothetical protein